MSENTTPVTGSYTVPSKPDGTYPVEKKVTAASTLGYIGSAVLFYVITGVSNDPNVLTPLPDSIEPLLLALVPGLLSLAGGFFAKHQNRA